MHTGFYDAMRSPEESKKDVVIIGGAGQMGSLYGDLFRSNGYDVKILDNALNAKSVAKEHGFSFMKRNLNVIKNADYVIFSVPIEVTEKVIEEYAGLIKEGAVAMDVTSVKEFAVEAMTNYAGKDVNVIGTHPMFRPPRPEEGMSLEDKFEKQNVILTKERINDQEIYDEVKNMFYEVGAKTIEITATLHDQRMAYVQGVVHATAIALADSIGKASVQNSEITMESLDELSSPVYRSTLEFILRIFEAKDMGLYANIQIENRYIDPALEDMESGLGKIRKFIGQKDRLGLKSYLEILQDPLLAYAKWAREQTDAMLGLNKQQVEIYYFERHEEAIINKLGTDNLVIKQYQEDSFERSLRAKKKREKNKNTDAVIEKDSKTKRKRKNMGVIKKAIVKKDGFLNQKFKEDFVVAKEIFRGAEEYHGLGRTVYNIDDAHFIETVLSNKRKAKLLSLFIPYKRIRFDSKAAWISTHDQRYKIQMQNKYADNPILNFFDTVAQDDWEEKEGRPLVVLRTQKTIHKKI